MANHSSACGKISNSCMCSREQSMYGGRIAVGTVFLLINFIGFDQRIKYVVICKYWNYQIQARQTGDQVYSDTSPMVSVLLVN